jgi:hypothetical protein
VRFLLDEMYSPAIAAACRARGVDVVSVHERIELEGQPDDAEVLRAAGREQRVLVSNNHRDLVPIVERFARDGEAHHGVLLTSDRSLPRSSASIGLVVRSIVDYAAGADDDLIDGYDWLPPASA